MIIKKYKLTAENSSEVEFEVTRIRRTTTTTSYIETVDDEGNIISLREERKPKAETTIDEGLSAVSLPSRMPANVEILEKFDPKNAPVPEIGDIEKNSTDPIKNRQQAVEEFNKVLNGQGSKPIFVPKNERITWADQEEK